MIVEAESDVCGDLKSALPVEAVQIRDQPGYIVEEARPQACNALYEPGELQTARDETGRRRSLARPKTHAKILPSYHTAED